MSLQKGLRRLAPGIISLEESFSVAKCLENEKIATTELGGRGVDIRYLRASLAFQEGMYVA